MTSADEHAGTPTATSGGPGAGTTAPAKVRRPPIPSLDGLRAVAVLIVLVSHSGYGEIVPGGLGVTIFFFLSGYLITTLLLDEFGSSGHIAIGHFYLRRAYRLLPPLFVLLAIAYALVALGWLGGGFSWRGLLSQIFYFANYSQIFTDAQVPAGTGIFWSLAVEEHFYIVYPVIMVLLLRVTTARRTIATIFGIMCVLALVWRIWLVSRPGFEELRTYYATDTRFDSILFGCILALVRNPARLAAGTPPSPPARMRPVDWGLLGVAVAVLLGTVLYRNPDFRETFRYSLQGLALMPIFYYAIRFATTIPFTVLSTRFLVRIGVLSYGIYLSHFVVLELVDENVDAQIPSPVRATIALGGAVLFSEFVDRVVDPYFRRRRAALH